MIKKESVGQMFSCEFFEISKNTFLHGTTLVAGSVLQKKNACFLLSMSYIYT